MLILMYHEITEGEPLEMHGVSRRNFTAQMECLRAEGYQTVGLAEALGDTARTLDKRVVITFDDGYLDNYTTAWPILKAMNFQATIFLVAGKMGQNSDWRTEDLGRPALMDWSQAREMAAAGMGFGSHTFSHPDLSRLPAAAVEMELRHSREAIEAQLKLPADCLAYPFSGVNESVKHAVERAGYRLACSCPTDYVGHTNRDRYDLRRITVFGRDSLDDFARKLRPGLKERAAWYRRQFGGWRRRVLRRSSAT